MSWRPVSTVRSRASSAPSAKFRSGDAGANRFQRMRPSQQLWLPGWG